MESKLRECPFCGETPRIDNETVTTVICNNPYCANCCNHFSIDEWNTRKHPSRGLVSLDEKELRNFISEQPECGEHYIDVELGYEGDLVDEICQRFGQREIKYPARKKEGKHDGHRNDDASWCYECNCSADEEEFTNVWQWNACLDEFKKLNPDTKEN